MSTDAVLELDLRSDPDSLCNVRPQVRDWALAHSWSEQQADEIVLALSEALSNVIRHAYHGERGHRILVHMAAMDDCQQGPGVEIRVRDFGRHTDPAQIRGRDLDDVRPGGLGVHIIRAMTNSAQYQQAEGGGMLLIMRKFRSHTLNGASGPAEQP